MRKVSVTKGPNLPGHQAHSLPEESISASIIAANRDELLRPDYLGEIPRGRSNSDCSGRPKPRIQEPVPIPARRHTFGTPPSGKYVGRHSDRGRSPHSTSPCNDYEVVRILGDKSQSKTFGMPPPSRRRSSNTVVRSSSDASDKSPTIFINQSLDFPPQPERRTSVPKRKQPILPNTLSHSFVIDEWAYTNDLTYADSVYALSPPLKFDGLSAEDRAELERLMFDCNKHTAIVDFLMPNGILIMHEVSTVAKLADIKEELWERARDFPLFGILRDREQYYFSCVSKGMSVDLMDEEKCLLEISPWINIIRLVEKKGDESEKVINNQIGQLIGKSLKEFDALRNPEVNDFRWKIRTICDEVVAVRNKEPWPKQVQYQHPCRLAPDLVIPGYIRDKMEKMSVDGNLYFSIQFEKTKTIQSTFTFCIKPEGLPNQLIELALNKRFSTIEADKSQLGRERPSDYLLKITGKEEYLVEEVPLIQYISVQEYISLGELQPMGLVAVHKSSIDVEIDTIYDTIQKKDSAAKLRDSFSSLTLSKKKLNSVSSWTIVEGFKILVGTISKVTQGGDEPIEIKVKGGLYHGNNQLCSLESTREVVIDPNEERFSIEQELSFDIDVCNIPRSSKLCFGIYELVRSTKTKNRPEMAKQYTENPIGWCNCTVYDYRGQFSSGSMTLYAWSCDMLNADMEIPNPLGTVVSNPAHDHAINLTITFTKYTPNAIIMFPANETVFKEAQNHHKEEYYPTEHQKIEIKAMAMRDPLTELHEQEMSLLWQCREYCCVHVPHVLPKLLLCVDWCKKEPVAQMMELLEKWPKLSPNLALELLDFAYPDPAVRNFAIKCLNTMTDDDLLLYLLQLVQALKHENYLHCHLVEFLLHRALRNMRIGHFFFWHLRSEMHVPSVSIRFGLILEAYCRGSAEHAKLLERQMTATYKCKELQCIVMQNRNVREKGLFQLKEKMKETSVKTALSKFLNPIDPVYRIDTLRIDKCKSMDSKMAPLWLVFSNSDKLGKDIYLLYKRGDDLRQDMLALQMIRIMDKLWKENGLDLRMNPYKCMSTDNKEGIIEVVTGAQTIANIHKKKAMLPMCAFRKESLLDWLKEHNDTDESLKKAIREFTLSCAGYCVATYVLGVMDRHSDNIMVMHNGQLFHIDFGHILGHYKEKFGIRRDRQPFVLTHDFIHVITNGSKSKSDEFVKFQQFCEDAFMVLRKHGSFIISLFAMMVSTGLPELQSVDKLNYLKETLQLNLPEAEAKKHFRSKFDEALSKAWSTSVNWAIHSFAKNNV